ncbi:MAG: Panacea domain-containing protein [Truepera sp.]|nr:Panacea domain-containing protein [Truepera sp.]
MMSQIVTQGFDADSALAALLFTVKRCKELGHVPNKHKVLKLLYFAEKSHLENYGRLIMGDDYYALEYGPVPTRVYNAIKTEASERICGRSDPCLNERVECCLKVTGNRLDALCEPNLDDLSESDVDHLSASVTQYGGLSFDQLSGLSHDDAWKQTVNGTEIPLEDIARTLPNHEVLLAYLRNPYPDRDDAPN